MPSSDRGEEPERKGADPSALMRASGQYMGYGLTLALSVLLFLGLGAWLDSKLGTSPLLLLVGAFIGMAAGFYSLYYHIVIEPRQRSGEDQ
jgi:F0F1-type ATP synthase assembly protein I